MMHKNHSSKALIITFTLGSLNACTESHTVPTDNTSLVGTWISISSDSIDVLDEEGDSIGKTLLTSTSTMTISNNGDMTTPLKWEYTPQFASATNTETTYLGNWKTIGDTLIRDVWPRSLASEDTSRYRINDDKLELIRIRTNSTTQYRRAE